MKKNWTCRILNIVLCISLVMPGFVLAEEAGTMLSDAALPVEAAVSIMQEEPAYDQQLSQSEEIDGATAAPETKAEPDAVVIDQGTTVTAYLGSPMQLTSHFTPDHAEAETRWFSSNSKIATIDYDGLLTPVKPGKVTVKVVSKNMKEDRITVHVVDPDTVAKVELDVSGTQFLSVGQTVQLNAAVYPETAQTTLKWGSSKKSVASVDQNGLVTAGKTGTVTITVKSGNGKKDTVKIQVVDPNKAAKVELDASGTIKLDIGDTLQLNAAITPATAQTSLKWSTSSKKIATVDQNGLVTPKKSGTATITVKTANGKKDTVKVKVYDKTLPTGIKVEQGSKLTMAVGQTLKLSALMKPETAVSDLKWSTSSTKYATVSSDGVVTAKKKGTVTIYVKTRNGKKGSVKIKIVSPTAPTGIALSHTGTVPMEAGDMLQMTAKLTPATAVDLLEWSSSDEKIASVKDGLVTAHAAGTAHIGVQSKNGLFAGCTLYVTKVTDGFRYFVENDEAHIVEYIGSDIQSIERAGGGLTVIIPEYLDGYRVTKIAEKAFAGNEEIEIIELPDSIREIADSAFEGCINLKRINIPNDAKLGKDVFKDCEYVTLHVEYGSAAYDYCRENGLRYEAYNYPVIDWPVYPTQKPTPTPTPTPSPTPTPTPTAVPDPVKYAYGDSADGKSTVIMGIMDNIMTEPVPDHLAIPAQLGGKPVTAIGENAFNGRKFGSVNIPDSVESIGANAFKDCTSLKSIVIPASVQTFGENVFGGCSADLVVIGEAGSAAEKYCSDNGIQFQTIAGADDFTVQENGNDVCITKYLGTDDNVVVPASIDGKAVTGIAANAFKGDTKVKSVTLFEGVTSIGAGAFEGATALTDIAIPGSVTSIGESAFKGSGIVSAALPAGVQKISDSVFENCKALIDIELPEGLTEIGAAAFKDCSALKSIEIPAKVTRIGESAFMNTGLTRVTVPAGVTEIAASTFEGCTSLVNITIPDSIVKIGKRAFADCSKLMRTRDE